MVVGKICPPRFMGTWYTISLVHRRPPGDCTKKFSFVVPIEISYFTTNVLLMNECDAPESKSITAGWLATGNIPSSLAPLSEFP